METSDHEGSFLTRVPWHLVLVVLAIQGVATLNLASAAQATRPNLWLVQIVWFALAWVIAFGVVRIRTYWIEAGTYPFFLFVCALLVLVLVAGTTVKGAQRWIDLGFFMLQPSELAKVAIILVTARYFSRYEVPDGYTLRDLLKPLNLSRPLGVMAILIKRWVDQAAEGEPGDATWMKTAAVTVVVVWAALAIWRLTAEGLHHQRILAPMDIVVIPFGLVLIEPDLGTSLIVISIAAVQVLFRGVRLGSFMIAFSGLAIVVGLIAASIEFEWDFLLKEYQRKRVSTFLDPEADIRGAGYHSAQSMIAIGSGGVTGKGRGQGTQTQLSFLPENHTDFVFSVLAEEWGLVGGAVLILLFMALVLLMLREGRQCTEPFAALVCVGSAAMMFWHVLINIGMVTGLMPVVGSTLPLMSYGGSSVITQSLAIALVMNTSVWRRE
jgi:rod shape determining protein RodA